jgi:hypothetical protein
MREPKGENLLKHSVSIVAFFLTLNTFAGSNFDVSVQEVRAILDVPNLGGLLNNGSISKIEKIDSMKNIFEIDTGFCKARVKVSRDETGVSSPKAEALGAECGP